MLRHAALTLRFRYFLRRCRHFIIAQCRHFRLFRCRRQRQLRHAAIFTAMLMRCYAAFLSPWPLLITASADATR